MSTSQFCFRATPETLANIRALQLLLDERCDRGTSQAAAIAWAIARAVEELRAADDTKRFGTVDRATQERERASGLGPHFVPVTS